MGIMFAAGSTGIGIQLVVLLNRFILFFFLSSRRRHTRLQGDWSSDVCSSDLSPPCRTPRRWPSADRGTGSRTRTPVRSPRSRSEPVLGEEWRGAGGGLPPAGRWRRRSPPPPRAPPSQSQRMGGPPGQEVLPPRSPRPLPPPPRAS